MARFGLKLRFDQPTAEDILAVRAEIDHRFEQEHQDDILWPDMIPASGTTSNWMMNEREAKEFIFGNENCGQKKIMRKGLKRITPRRE